MTEEDDLFEFGNFENDDALELDLEDLFGELELLVVDPSAPIPTAAEQAAATVAAAEPVQPATTEVPPVAAAGPAVAPPIAPAPQVAYAPPGGMPQGAPYVIAGPAPAGRLPKANIAIAVAAIVTLANVAVIAAPLFKAEPSNIASASLEVNQQADPVEASIDTVMLDRINELEQRVMGINSPPEAIRSGSGQRHRAFDEIDNNLASGEYVVARQRLYSLLAIVDRFPSHERDRIEELASYTLADTFRLEAEREGQSKSERQQ